MNTEKMNQLLSDLQNGTADLETTQKELSRTLFPDIENLRFDSNREERTGIPEVIFCKNKSYEQIYSIFKHAHENQIGILGTWVYPEIYEKLNLQIKGLKYNAIAKTLLSGDYNESNNNGSIAIISGGTSDMPVVEEAYETARFLGNKVEKFTDIGVAGIHRLYDKLEQIKQANVIIAVAGMEGALASVIAGLVDKPVIAVPTSVGYGASFNGIAALLSMLNSCAPGISVVNIDNGFGAACQAHLITQQIKN